MAKYYWLEELGDWRFVWKEAYTSLNKARRVAVEGMKKYNPRGYSILECSTKPDQGRPNKIKYIGYVKPVGKKAAWVVGEDQYRINPDGSLGSKAHEMDTYYIQIIKDGKKMPVKKVRASTFYKMRLNVAKMLRPGMTIELLEDDGDCYGKMQLREYEGKLVPMLYFTHSRSHEWRVIKSDGSV